MQFHSEGLYKLVNELAKKINMLGAEENRLNSNDQKRG